jgi:hypothetical protein
VKYQAHNQTFNSNGQLIAEEVVEVIEYPTPEASLVAAARLVVLPVLDTLPVAEVEQFAGLFPDWQPGVAVKAGEVYRHDGELVRVVQAHTTQADWEPQTTPNLWTVYRAPDVAAPWVQPAGGHDAYQIDALVTYNGQTWRNTSANNVYAPGVHGWVVV